MSIAIEMKFARIARMIGPEDQEGTSRIGILFELGFFLISDLLAQRQPLNWNMSERDQDYELLRQFTRRGGQAAFAALVRRHLDLVYATALGKFEDPGAAEEVARNVFAILARRAWQGLQVQLISNDSFMAARFWCIKRGKAGA